MEEEVKRDGKPARSMGDRISEYVFLDVETSGLDPRKDCLLEIGAVHAIDIGTERGALRYTMSTFSVLVAPEVDPKYWDPKVVEMHTEDGLLAELESGAAIPLRSAIRMLQGWINYLASLKRFSEHSGKPILSNNFVEFDAGFLRAAEEKQSIPVLSLFDERRRLDVSSTRRFLQMAQPTVSWETHAGYVESSMPEHYRNRKHRALPDAVRALRETVVMMEYIQ